MLTSAAAASLVSILLLLASPARAVATGPGSTARFNGAADQIDDDGQQHGPRPRYMGFYRNSWYETYARGGSRLATLANSTSWANLIISENSSFLVEARRRHAGFSTLFDCKWLLFEQAPGSPPNWLRAVPAGSARQTLESLAPLFHGGTDAPSLTGLFLGDELMAPYADINSTVELIRSVLGDSPLLYINQMQIFSGPSGNCKPLGEGTASRGWSGAEPCPTCWWPAVPAGLDLVGFDMYADGAKEPAAVRSYASRCLYPLLSPSQRFVAVPGIFADGRYALPNLR